MIPFRNDHVGSFLRPANLSQAREQYKAGNITYESLKAVEDQEIIRIIEKQKENGVFAVTDGEFRRSWWHFDFLGGLDGVELYEEIDGPKFHNMQTRKGGIRVVGKVDFSSHPFIGHFEFLLKHAGDAVAKQTIPSPNMLIYRLEPGANSYNDREQFLQDTIATYQKAIQAFYDAGCRYLQLDDTAWADLFSEAGHDKLRAKGLEPAEELKIMQRMINETLAHKPADLVVTMHICRGNYKSNYFSTGGYDYASEVIFGGLDVDGLFLEFDDERSGSFEPLKYVNRPDLKIVLGLLTSKTGELEDKEHIKARIAEAATYVPLEQLCLSPQCGFSSTEEGNILTEEQQWRKLRYVKEIAEEVWKADQETVVVEAFINGHHVPSLSQSAKENPANQAEIVGYFPVTTKEQAVEAIEAAAEAFKIWKKTSIDERITRMRKAIEKIRAAENEIVHLLSREHGKPLYDAHGEIYVSLMWMEFACNEAASVLQEEVQEHDHGKTILSYDPMGVVAAISPWNYPIALSTIKIAPALLAGNTIVLKPSPFAPLAAAKVAELIAGEFPAGVINVVHGDADVGVELTSNPLVGKIAFTGGTATAKHIIKAASETIKDMTLELGGNDAAIFLDSFDVQDERAMRRIVISNFLTTGQICMIAKRVYVHRSIYDGFVEKYIEAANRWIRIGDPFDANTTVGPVNNLKQKNYVQGLIEGARQRGAKVIPLGQILDQQRFEQGYYLQPTLVLDCDYHDPIVVEEQFGPTVPILPFDDVEQVIHLHNESIYGLTSSVWGREEDAVLVARQLEAGTTMINTAAVQGLDVRFPFGGFKQSGIGREYGAEGIRTYTELHVINVPKTLDLPYIPE